MMRSILRLALAAALFASSAPGQGGAAGYILDWLPDRPTPKGFIDSLHERLGKLVDTLVRYTSPDIPRDSRRLWRISLDGQDACVVSTDTGVHMPRWGSAGFIVYLVEADTNGDGRIDFLDDYLVRIVSDQGGKGQTIGRGKSATWSPDGQFIAILLSGKITLVSRSGETVAGAATSGGQVVMSNSLNPELARTFWALDVRTGGSAPLPDDLQRKYLWLGMLSPSGSKIVFSNAMRKNIILLNAGESEGRKLIDNGALNLEPTWSPDEKQITYVSTKSGGGPCGSR